MLLIPFTSKMLITKNKFYKKCIYKFFIVSFVLITLLINGCNNSIKFLNESTSIKKEKTDLEIEKKTYPDGNIKIDSYSFGSIVIDGETYGDIKIYNNQITPWMPTQRHKLTKGDIQGATGGVRFIIVGTGYYGEVQIENDVLILLDKKGVTLIAEETKKAIDEYNRLAGANEKVAAIFHATC